MTEHRRNILVTDCLEANAYYNSRLDVTYSASYDLLEFNAYNVIAEAYLMRSEALTK